MTTFVGEVFPGNIFRSREGLLFVLINSVRVGGCIILATVEMNHMVRVVKYKNLATITLLNPQVFD